MARLPIPRGPFEPSRPSCESSGKPSRRSGPRVTRADRLSGRVRIHGLEAA
jgi:hypothetical protein